MFEKNKNDKRRQRIGGNSKEEWNTYTLDNLQEIKEHHRIRKVKENI